MSIEISLSFTNFSNDTYQNTTTSAIQSLLRLVPLTCMILIDISAFLGNLLVICAFFRTRRLQTVTNYFIASLAFADALVAIFVLPLSIYCYQRNRSWKLGLILCDLWVSSDVLLCTSSILNLTCISVDRYMAITKPLTYTAYRSKFLARIMILLVWIVSAVITCPPIFGWRDKNRRQMVEENYQCDLNTARGYVIYSALGSFYIPGVVMIFVYIRIFMVVYDRENLIKKFHNNNNNNNNNTLPINNTNPTANLIIKSNTNGITHNIPEISAEKKKFQRISSCCCFCFRRKSSISSHHTCPGIEQKPNGYLIYRFTNNNSNHNYNNYNSNTSSPRHSPSMNSKASVLSRSCPNSSKKMSNMSDDIYQYRRNYLAHTSADYQVHNDDTPCYELKSLEKLPSPLMKCRSRSFEHTSLIKIRDLNAELSHSRQLKAAAVAAASSVTNKNIKNQFDQQIDLSRDIFPSAPDSPNSTAQSLHELTQIPLKKDTSKHRKRSRQHLNVFPMRERATTNPPKIQEMLTDSPSFPHSLRQKQMMIEPTRINRRIKSSRSMNSSPSAILLENIKQQHRITRNPSIRSTQSSRSLASMRYFTHSSENSNDSHPNPKSVWNCCCYCFNSSSSSNSSQNITRQIFVYTPNHSLTMDDDDDEKMSSTDTANRAPLYTPVQSSSVAHVSSRGNGGPGDVQRRERIRFMKEQKTAKTLAVVVGGFILLWLPFFIMYIIPQEKFVFHPHTNTLITWLGYFNSVINPFIYAYCSKQFRMAFWNITFGVCIKRSSVLLPLANKNKQLHQRRMNE
ncbi:hypothetical protein I4U23_026507 [Adineta vaga]|nr:hypothetical protein I4U23_026507 [Adineta vaga]